MARRAENTEKYFVPIDGFSQIIPVAPGGTTLYLSGLTARTVAGEVVALGDMGGQVRQIMENMRMILTEAGASLDDVVNMRTYTTDITRWDEVEAVWRSYWGDVWPASTMVQITRLFDERQMIEIEATAVVR